MAPGPRSNASKNSQEWCTWGVNSPQTDDFWRDYRRLTGAGVDFVRPPAKQPYGTVAVFRDLYGNLWDLLQYKEAGP